MLVLPRCGGVLRVSSVTLDVDARVAAMCETQHLIAVPAEHFHVMTVVDCGSSSRSRLEIQIEQ